MRIGQGFDVHAFAPGDHLMLGGERIAHTHGVAAHSDGDVVIHALCDALLGALALGDLAGGLASLVLGDGQAGLDLGDRIPRVGEEPPEGVLGRPELVDLGVEVAPAAREVAEDPAKGLTGPLEHRAALGLRPLDAVLRAAPALVDDACGLRLGGGRAGRMHRRRLLEKRLGALLGLGDDVLGRLVGGLQDAGGLRSEGGREDSLVEDGRGRALLGVREARVELHLPGTGLAEDAGHLFEEPADGVGLEPAPDDVEGPCGDLLGAHPEGRKRDRSGLLRHGAEPTTSSGRGAARDGPQAARVP